MSTVPLKLRSVADLVEKNEVFFIPNYQRGYRWDADQVEALLNDLAKFEANKGSSEYYCLQPLVVVKRDKDWEVVDGQQRLTTIFLILRQLNNPSFQIHYARHPERENGLSELLQPDSAAGQIPDFVSPDLYFLEKADEAIQKWFEEPKHKHCQLPSLTDPNQACAKFIWHEIEEKDANHAFTRLNAGKIKLRDSELIRALFLGTGVLDQDDRHLIALRWDQIERRLQDPEFWSFLSGRGSTDNRIELLFEWIARQRTEQNKWTVDKDRQIFDLIFDVLKDSRERKKLWQEVDELFGTLEEWFEDNRLFHMIGFLVEVDKNGEMIPILLKESLELKKTEFTRLIKKKIRKHVLGENTSRDKLEGYLKDLKYDEPNARIKELLLCLNLATLNADIAGTVRFSFQAYKKDSWDIEHIRATASREPEKPDELRFALASINAYWDPPPPANKTLLEDLVKVRKALNEKSDDRDHLYKLYCSLRDQMEGMRGLGASNGLMNLTLLDAGTNRGYGNSPFAVKRAWVLGLNQQTKYLLPCTRSVFTKSYSKAPDNLLNWTPEDATDYLSEITSTLDTFFADTWEEKAPGSSRGDSDLTKPDTQGQIISAPTAPGDREDTKSPERNGQRVSFVKLIAEYDRVEIPLIQRDYAQGRASAKAVREKFLTDLLNALKHNAPLSLDFVYGEVVKKQRYGEVVEKRIFQPIDGQQRLTTLFLLHWFLACAADKLENFRKIMKDVADKENEARFRYSVRPSSHQFFSKLLNYKPEDLDKPPAEQIQNQTWFFRAWRHDPTIVGALTMLDAIHTKFASEEGLRDFYANLAESPSAPITMDVLDLGSLGLSDEIYVKMNARGKELTGFEKFKAWLIETHGEIDWPKNRDLPKWKLLLDWHWLDLFWHFQHDKPQPADAVSKVYFRTFVALAVNFHASLGNFEKAWLEADAEDQAPLWDKLFTLDCVEHVFDGLNCLSPRDQSCEWPIVSLRRRLIDKGVGPFDKHGLDAVFFEGTAKPVTIAERLWLHAIHIFLRNPIPAGGPEEVHWFRVVRNLLANTQFEAKNFANAIKSLDKLGSLAKKHGSMLDALSDDKSENSLVGFQPEQFLEEKRKAQLIRCSSVGSEWEPAIIVAEAHPIFNGQIDLLLPPEDDLKTFKHRLEVFARLFDNEGKSYVGMDDEFLVARAVLAQSKPIKLGWQQKIIFVNTKNNWSEILDHKSGQKEFRDGMLCLIDSINGNSYIEAGLRKMIESPRADETYEPWMLDIIRHGGELLTKYSDHKKIQNYCNNGFFLFRKVNWNEHDILLGASATLRNRLIDGLLNKTHSSWELPGAEWRRLIIGQSDKNVFFKGHHIKLTRKAGDGNDTAECRFEYDKLVICVPDSDGIPIQFPEDGKLSTFLASIESKLGKSPLPKVEPVLSDLRHALASVNHQNE
ncbi:MAG: DUF262 domain-containing protein [Verrucomicrobiota bacterium]